MESTYVYRNPHHGAKRTYIADSEQPGVLRVHTEIDMEEVLEGIKRDRDIQKPNTTNKLVARVPMTVMETAIHEQWDEADWKKWLNDPANAHFRIWQGRV